MTGIALGRRRPHQVRAKARPLRAGEVYSRRSTATNAWNALP
jgi:hypothetical protein